MKKEKPQFQRHKKAHTAVLQNEHWFSDNDLCSANYFARIHWGKALGGTL
jgi:hypothetical protein